MQTSHESVERCFYADLSTDVLETIWWKTEAYNYNKQVSRRNTPHQKSGHANKASLYYCLSRLTCFPIGWSIGGAFRSVFYSVGQPVIPSAGRSFGLWICS